MMTTKSRVDAALAAYFIAGLVVSFSLVGGLGVWAATTEIAGAVIAPGLVVVETSVKKVQHPTGGVVGEIRVRNGMKVEAGDLLIRLDETITRANLQAITKQLDELLISEARLKAERDDASSYSLPDALKPRAQEPAIAEILHGEQSLFRTRRSANEGAKAQLQERVVQLKDEHGGILAQIDAKTREIGLIATELDSLIELEEKQLVTSAKMAALRREKARLDGELGQYKATAAQTNGRVAEIGLQALRLEQEFKTEVVRDLRETQSKIAELTERRVAAEDQLRRVEIRAPQSGLVHQLSVFTVGGVVNPSEPVMLIVPENDRLVIDARIAPKDIDQIHIDQSTWVRFSTFNQRTTPELIGEVMTLSADLSRDQVTGESYFTARVAIPDSELQKLGENRLLPGMPAEVQIKTAERTALSYLLKPLTDQFSRAFRER